MGLFDYFKTNKTSLITEDDQHELMEIKRKAYMDAARKIMEEKGKREAQDSLMPQVKKEKMDWN
jgi:hypothetical protein